MIDAEDDSQSNRDCASLWREFLQALEGTVMSSAIQPIILELTYLCQCGGWVTHHWSRPQSGRLAQICLPPKLVLHIILISPPSC